MSQILSDPSDLIRTADLAERLNVCPDTIHNWTRKGILPRPAIETGKFRLYSLREVEEHLARRREGAADVA